MEKHSRKTKLATYWTQHLESAEEKEEFEKLIRNNAVIRRLREIIEQREEGIQRQEKTFKTYEMPNWAYLQAHRNGYLQALKEIKDLIGE